MSIPPNSNHEWVTRVTLLEKAKDSTDEIAWTEFVRYYRKYIYNVIRHMGLPHHDADEVVQMTLLKVWNAMPSFDYKPEKGHFRGWLCKIAGNCAKNYLRDRGPQEISLSVLDSDSQDSLDFSVKPEIESLAEKEWELYLPELAMKNISSSFDAKTIKVFTMLTKGLAPAEIAETLAIAESSVYVYKQRVKKRLTEEIAKLRRELD